MSDRHQAQVWPVKAGTGGREGEFAAPGGTLRAAPAKWSSTPTSIAYRWQLCRGTVCTAIGGATKTRLKVTKAYVRHSVRVVAIATIHGVTVKSASRKVTIRKR